jgi:hypothetical protein
MLSEQQTSILVESFCDIALDVIAESVLVVFSPLEDLPYGFGGLAPSLLPCLNPGNEEFLEETPKGAIGVFRLLHFLMAPGEKDFVQADGSFAFAAVSQGVDLTFYFLQVLNEPPRSVVGDKLALAQGILDAFRQWNTLA